MFCFHEIVIDTCSLSAFDQNEFKSIQWDAEILNNWNKYELIKNYTNINYNVLYRLLCYNKSVNKSNLSIQLFFINKLEQDLTNTKYKDILNYIVIKNNQYENNDTLLNI